MTPWQLGPDWLTQRLQSMVRSGRWHWLILLLWMVPLMLAGFFDLDHQSLMAHDEGLYARRARVIVDTGDWIHPWDKPHHKTPGPYWLVALFIQLLGRHEVAVRLPSVLASMGCIWLTYAIGRRLLTPTAALLGALSLGVAPLWLQYSRLATPDVAFTGLILLAVWLLLGADASVQLSSPPLARPTPSRHAAYFRWLWFGAGATLGLTVLLRSALAAVPMACLLPYLLLSGRHHLKQWSFYLGGLAGLLPTAIWLWLCWRRYDMAVINALINFPVSQGLTADRAKSPLFYLFNLGVNDFPWVFFALGAVMWLLAPLVRSTAIVGPNISAKVSYLCRPQVSLLLCYPLFYLGLLSFASTKLPHYAIPTYPFLALLAGYAMDRLVHPGANFGVSFGANAGARFGANAGLHITLKRLLGIVNGLLLVLGMVLMVAAGLAMTTHVLPSTHDIRPYAPIALVLGLVWVGAGGLWFKVWFKAQPQPQRLMVWLIFLLLGHWLSLVVAWGTAGLGNINPEMKALLIRQDIQPILQTEVVHFSPGLNSKRSTLLRFYTPNPGGKLSNLEGIAPQDYLWIEAGELSSLPQPHDSLGQIKQTHLVRILPE